MNHKLFTFITLLIFNFGVLFSQSYTNNTPHNFTNSTPFTATIPVSGVASGKILRQVTLKFGDGAMYSAELARATITLKDPNGTVITLMDPQNFNNNSTTTDADRKYLNMTLRDHSALYTPWQWASATGNFISNAYPFNYGYWKSVGSYSAFSGNPNGNWEITISYAGLNSSYARKYISSEIVFGDDFEEVDIRTPKPNQSCETRHCLETGKIYLATNIGYPDGQPNVPLTIGGCTWNAAKNNSAWFYFTASSSTVEFSVSGMSKKIESVVVTSDDCQNFNLVNGGCPTTMYNSSGNFTQYFKQSYAGGYSQNHGYTLTGLTVGQEYILILDGMDQSPQAPTASDFYIEIESGADNGCCPEILLAEDVSNTDCDANTGTVTISVSGGEAPYTYDFNDGNGYVSTNTLTNLGANTYTYSVKDANGCTVQGTFTIEEAEPPVISVTGITPEDCGQENGGITISVTGGSTPYTYSWSDGSTSQNLSNVEGGTYTVTVTDSKGCVATETATINTLGSTVSIDDFQITPPLCNSSCDGEITVIVSGGSNLNYQWYDEDGNPVGTNSATLTGVCDGNYSVTVSEGSGSGGSSTTVFTEDFENGTNGWNLNSVVGSEGGDANFFKISDAEGGVAPGGCGVGNNGDATLHITSQILPNAGAAYNAGGLCFLGMCVETHRQAESPLINTVGLTGLTLEFDFIANGQTNVDKASVWYNDGNGWAQLGADLYSGTSGCGVQGLWTAYSSALPTSCENISNLQIAIRWDNNDDGVGTDPSVAINNIVITAGGGGGGSNDCSVTESVTVNAPAQLDITNIDITTATCGEPNGGANITVSGGTSPYSYSWSNGSTSQNLSNVAGGSYTVTVTDANDCTITETIILPSTNAPTITVGTITPASCGATNGGANITVSGGSSPYSYSWSNGSTSQNLSNVGGGSYTVTVTDANGCTATETVIIPSTNSPTITVGTISPASCGATNGGANITVSGGSSPYSYSWSNGSTSQNLSNVGGGSYTVTVTDANGCTATETVVVPSTNSPTITVGTISPASCGATNGGANITVSGGSSPYTYSWSNGSTGQNLSNVGGGSYTVTVTDANGCTATETVVIPSTNSPTITVGTISPANCGGTDGGANITVSGGSSPYTYSWSNGSSSQNLSNVGGGSYTVTVTDANGCTATETVIIPSTSGPTITVDNISTANCGATDGGANITVSGGDTPYTYSWSDGSTSQNLSNVAGGTYTVTVTDANGCTATETVVVPSTNSPTISVDNISTANCGASDGGANITVSGGSSPYTYSWSNGSTSQNLSNVAGGTYTVTVTDANGCSATETVVVPATSTPTITVGTISPANCGASDGGANITVSDGNSPYTYSWSNGSASQNLSNVAGGTYTVTVTDANGCTATETVVVPSTDAPVITIDNITPADCGVSDGGATITVSDGTAPYTYSWSDGSTSQNLSNAAGGSYTVTVTDANGCSTTEIVIIPSTSGPTITVDDILSANCDGADGGATISVGGGDEPYTYNWSDGSTNQNISNVPGGTYTVTVTDASGCTASEVITIPSTSAPTISVDDISTANCGESDGGATITVSGGDTPYTYDWSDGSTDPNLNNVAGGTYTVTVTDANGCSATETVIVPATSAPTITVDAIFSANCGATDGGADITVSGGDAPYTYDWSDGSTDQNLSNVAGGTYTVTVTDANGCTATETVTISSEGGPELSVVSVSNVSCFNANDGSIEVEVNGGTPGYTYHWNPNVSNGDSASNLEPGVYEITVEDNNGCTDVVEVTITEPSELIVTEEISDASCGAVDGMIILDVSGGTPDYQFNWTPNVSNSTSAENLPAGEYTVLVTDANNCTKELEFVVETSGSFATSVTPTDTIITEGESVPITLLVDPNITVTEIVWYPEDGLSCTDCPNPIATPDETTTYYVDILSEDGCYATDTVVIYVDKTCGDFFIPTSFSPDNNGVNDLQCVMGGCIDELDFTIYNRWGETVFHTNDQSICWDGYFRGKPVQSGSYVYKVRAVLGTGKLIEETGNINVVR